MIGARKKMDENGLDVAGLRRRRIWVRAQRNPEKNAAERMRTKPGREKEASPLTMRITPQVMTVIMVMRMMDGCSRWNTKAKSKTKARDEDLTMAVG